MSERGCEYTSREFRMAHFALSLHGEYFERLLKRQRIVKLIGFVRWYAINCVAKRRSRIIRSREQDSRFEIRDSRFEIRDSRFEIRDSRFEIRTKRTRFPASVSILAIRYPLSAIRWSLVAERSG
jgi:hypothetical protein